MKKLGILFATVIMIVLFALSASASLEPTGKCGDNVYWNYNKSTGELVITGYGNMFDYKRGDINETSPFAMCDEIKSVTFGEGITRIGKNTFVNCTSIEKINISDSITSIGDYAFFECIKIKNISLPNSITSIEKGAFYNCISLININIPNSVSLIDDYTFQGCNSLENLYIPESVISIGKQAFLECYSLNHIMVDENNKYLSNDSNGVLFDKQQATLIQYPAGANDSSYLIPDTVTSICDFAFHSSRNLDSVLIPESVISIGKNAFDYTGLYDNPKNWDDGVLYIGKNLISADMYDVTGSYSIREGTTVIAGKAFYHCFKITDIIFPDSVVSIGEDSFNNCDCLSYVDLPVNLNRIDEYAFWGCDMLQTVKVSSSVSYIASTAFDNCIKLNSIIVDEKNTTYSSDVNGILFNKEKTVLKCYPSGLNDICYTVPDGVIVIDDFAFKQCKNLKSIIIPNSVIEIGNSAFRSCSSLTDIIIPTKVTVIREGTFSNCSNLECITFDVNINEIEDNAFLQCNKLKTVYYVDTEFNWGKIKKGNNSILFDANVIVDHKHDYRLVNTKSPTCTEEGEFKYLCKYNDIRIIPIKSEGHKNVIYDKGKPATVAEVGYTAGNYCLDCEQWVDGHREIPKLLAHTHSYSYSVTSNSTCTTTGTTTFTCTCGDTYTEVIPATNHPNATTDTGKAPTATEVGYTKGKYCPDCKTWIEGHTEIPALEEHKHSYAPTTTQEATCWREGVKTYTCSCGDTYTEAIAKLEHEYRPWETKKKPTCTEPGLEWSYCLICDNDFEREIPAEGHNEYAYTRRATPAEAGAYVVACDKCWIEFSSVSFGRPAEYKLSTTTYTYNGKAKTPKLTVITSDGKVLKKGVDYTVELPKERTSVGTHTYRVVFMGDYLGETKVSYQILPGKTSSVSASQSTTSIKLSWKKVTGATGYRVYQYNSSTGKYKTLKTLTGTSYTVKNLKAGTTYKFAVKAYIKADGETLWAASSKTLTTATKPATPKVKATAGSGKATLSWSKVTGATGYVIYMEDSFGDFEKVTSTTKTSYTKKSLKKGKTYKFRVKAYKKVDGKYIYSGYKTYSVKVK